MVIPTLQLEATAQSSLRMAWQELAGTKLSGPELASVGNTVWELLQAAYTEPARHYHNLAHIQALLVWAAEYRTCLQDFAAVQFAIWFHDAVYDTKRSDNEERSAALAVQTLQRLNISAPVIQSVEAMILATKLHQLSDRTLGDRHEDMAWFLDFDLAILGSPPALYQAYREAIRQEYRWVPGILFRRKRRQVLENFRQRERLFFTTELRQRLEVQARRNLEEELALLK